MARIQSLSVLDTESGKDYLAESYGKVIANVGKNTISSKLKNTDLSGVPGAGSVEAKRFVNRKSNNYGTARSGGKGQQAKAKAVTVAIDTDKELITEVEQKDVSLYGVDNFIERQVAMDEKSMIRGARARLLREGIRCGHEGDSEGNDSAGEARGAHPGRRDGVQRLRRRCRARHDCGRVCSCLLRSDSHVPRQREPQHEG